jgi:hypothetical protein
VKRCKHNTAKDRVVVEDEVTDYKADFACIAAIRKAEKS